MHALHNHNQILEALPLDLRKPTSYLGDDEQADLRMAAAAQIRNQKTQAGTAEASPLALAGIVSPELINPGEAPVTETDTNETNQPCTEVPDLVNYLTPPYIDPAFSRVGGKPSRPEKPPAQTL